VAHDWAAGRVAFAIAHPDYLEKLVSSTHRIRRGQRELRENLAQQKPAIYVMFRARRRSKSFGEQLRGVGAGSPGAGLKTGVFNRSG